jgi:hypothetical protein
MRLKSDPIVSNYSVFQSGSQLLADLHAERSQSIEAAAMEM